jgi:hypothetical protein
MKHSNTRLDRDLRSIHTRQLSLTALKDIYDRHAQDNVDDDMGSADRAPDTRNPIR